MSHVDVRLFTHELRVRLAKTGCYIEYDLFGAEGYLWTRMAVSEDHPRPSYMPNDASRVDAILALIEAGYLEKLLISHDICFKTRLCRYGGHGYAHILQNVLPLMREQGMSEDMVRAITVENPSRMLQFV